MQGNGEECGGRISDCRISDIGYVRREFDGAQLSSHLSDIRYPVSGIRYPVSGIRHPALELRRFARRFIGLQRLDAAWITQKRAQKSRRETARFLVVKRRRVVILAARLGDAVFGARHFVHQSQRDRRIARLRLQRRRRLTDGRAQLRFGGVPARAARADWAIWLAASNCAMSAR